MKNLLNKLCNLLKSPVGVGKKPDRVGTISPLEEWYVVSWDAERVYRSVAAPGNEPWNDSFAWEDIKAIALETKYVMEGSDNIYFFVHSRKESYLIPMEAKNGMELWNEVLNKGLFDAELAIHAASQEGMYIWPEPRDENS